MLVANYRTLKYIFKNKKLKEHKLNWLGVIINLLINLHGEHT